MTNVEKRIKLEDVLGNKYYNYNLTSSNYNPLLNSSITLTCIVTNTLGDVVSGKELQLFKNGVSLGASYKKTTNSNGVATWSITCNDGGLQTYSIDIEEIEIFVDNKANSTHTHTTSNITDFPNLSTVATTGSYTDLTSKPSYTPTITSSTSGAYKIGSININGSNVDIYGKDTHQSLTNYIQKTSTDTGYLKSDGSIDTNTYLTTHQDISNKEDISNKSSNIITDTGSTTKYPSVKAIEDYAEPKQEAGTFTELIALINNTPTGKTITLDKDYINSEELTGSTTFSNEIHIDGNGHILDFNYKNYYFQFSGEKSSIENWIVEHFQYTIFAIVFKNIIIDNCIFRNSNSNLQSTNSLILTTNASNFLMVNCQFYNIKASSLLLITLNGTKQYIKNCIFYNNHCNNVIFSNGGDKPVNNTISCVFENNMVYDGVIKHNGVSNKNTIVDCIFNNNTTLSGNGSAINCKETTVLINNKYLTSNDTVYPTTLVDKNYLTEHQDISGKLDKTQTSYKGKNVVVDSSSGEITFEDKNNHTHSSYLTSSDITGKENTSNKVKSTSGWSSTTTDDHYPSEKLVKSSLDNKVDKENGKGLFSGSYNDLSDKPSYTATVTSSTTGAYKMGSINISGSSVDIYGKDTHQSLTNYIQKTSTDTGYLKSNGNIASLPTASTSQSGVVQLSNSTSSSSETLGATAKAVKTVYESIPTIPTNISSFTNDSGYLTSQDITGKLDTDDLMDELNNIIEDLIDEGES